VSALNLEILTPERVLVREEVDAVEASGVDGEFGILPGHTQFLTILKIGEVRFAKGGKTVSLATSGGFAEVVEDKVTFLLDTGELAEEIDVSRAKRAMERAEAMLKTMSYDHADYRRQELALYRAIARIGVASKKI